MSDLRTAEQVKKEIFEELGLKNVTGIDEQLVQLCLERWETEIRADQLTEDNRKTMEGIQKVFG